MRTAPPNDQLDRLREVAARYRQAHDAYEAAVEDRVEAMERARQSGVSVAEIAEVMDLSHDQVTSIADVARHWC